MYSPPSDHGRIAFVVPAHGSCHRREGVKSPPPSSQDSLCSQFAILTLIISCEDHIY